MNWNDSNQVEELKAYLALLAVPGVGPTTLVKLVARFKTARCVLEQSLSALNETPGVTRPAASEIASSIDSDQARKLSDRIHELGWNVVLNCEGSYPAPLLELPNRPPVIFYLGEIREKDFQAIAVVGTRQATEEGRAFADALSFDLAQAGVTVVSGMAIGIDQAAHKGALRGAGRTLAVLGSSLDYRFNPAVRKTLDRIIESGAVMSELPPESPPLPENFPRRNRIISGLSQGVVIIEADLKSGALLTARDALDQNREVFATPGFPTRRLSRGCNQLLKDGANTLTGVEDIFLQLPRLKGEVVARRACEIQNLTSDEELIIRQVSDGPMQLDSLARNSGLGVSEIMPTLLTLELKGLVKELAGKRYTIAS